jgi:hypothetical protein
MRTTGGCSPPSPTMTDDQTTVTGMSQKSPVKWRYQTEPVTGPFCDKCGRAIVDDEPMMVEKPRWRYGEYATRSYCPDCHEIPYEDAALDIEDARWWMSLDSNPGISLPIALSELPTSKVLWSPTRGGWRLHLCRGCGRWMFLTGHDSAVFRCCSARCYKRASRKRTKGRLSDVTCNGCGESFTPKRADARYCSSACRQRAYRGRRAEGKGA